MQFTQGYVDCSYCMWDEYCKRHEFYEEAYRNYPIKSTLDGEKSCYYFDEFPPGVIENE